MDTSRDDGRHPRGVGVRLPRHLRGQPEVAVVDRVVTERGELVLRRVGDDCEVISNGVFLMDTRDGRSERLLVRAALDLLDRDHAADVLIGGLGVGFSLAAAVADPRVAAVTVVEIEQTVIDWHATHLRPFSDGALDDPRVTVIVGDLRSHLDAATDRYDVVCLDVDNGPTWTVSASNDALYDDTGTELLARTLRPGGVLAVWSAEPVPGYERRLRRRFGDVRILTVDVARGEPDVVYVAQLPG